MAEMLLPIHESKAFLCCMYISHIIFLGINLLQHIKQSKQISVVLRRPCGEWKVMNMQVCHHQKTSLIDRLTFQHFLKITFTITLCEHVFTCSTNFLKMSDSQSEGGTDHDSGGMWGHRGGFNFCQQL